MFLLLLFMKLYSKSASRWREMSSIRLNGSLWMGFESLIHTIRSKRRFIQKLNTAVLLKKHKKTIKHIIINSQNHI